MSLFSPQHQRLCIPQVQPVRQLLELDEMQTKMDEFYGVAGNNVRVGYVNVLKDCYYAAQIGGTNSWFRVKIVLQVDQEVGIIFYYYT